MTPISSDDGNYNVHTVTVTMVCECFPSPLTAQAAAEFFMEQMLEELDGLLHYPMIVLSGEVLEYAEGDDEAEVNLNVLVEDNDRAYIDAHADELPYSFA